ncbi:uncharacterized protein CDV56_104462 [Aspergillus thermomutatus]|uniref:Cytochrome b561 domain-containing protein n=1 Tax=Aspergillus thermomutatus TaxID=41047 RepID=A0A397GA09_ASPTH|nr:uncharacterized protein CDV56_104462 [Aspergillus thermomutatus]RHZ46226.1 hypothetical protein CDV56_104462 [Aspergillus thermomutatus]
MEKRIPSCDFSRPGCNKCYTAGVECPGYDDKKPLKWVTPCEVTSRPRKKTVQQTSTKQHVSRDRSDSQVEPVSLGVPRDRLVNEFGAVVEAAYYYNSCILPEYTCLLQLAENPFITAFPMESLPHIPPPIHCTLVSLALSHRFHRLLPQNSRSDLREIEAKHYRHRGQAIRYLGEEIGRPDKCRTDKTLAGVMMLLFSDSRQSTSPNWRHHFTGVLEMIMLRGGVEKLLHSAPHLKALLLYFMMYDLSVGGEHTLTRSSIGVISNTTTPPSDHIPLGSDIRSIDVVFQMYGDGFFPLLLCPPALLANIIQINHLRLQAFSHPSTEHKGKALALLDRITAFSAEQWAISCAAPEQGIILGHVYRSAVILYCILSLQSLSVLPRMAQLNRMRVAHTKELFSYLKEACEAPGMGKCMLWPLVVAGVCAQGDLAMRQFVDRQLSAMGTDIGTPLPLLATVVFRNFWETPLAASQIYSFSPASNVVYSVTVPASTVSSNSGPIYFQIRAPTSYQWVALGEGSKMAGSNMFIMYAASANNITLSPRSSTGHSEPDYNSDAQIDLLDGTGISNGYMTANVRCNSCLQWTGGSLDTSSISSKWIWATKKGSAIDSSDLSYNLAQHDSYGTQTVNMTQARMTTVNATNPFAGYNATAAAQTTGKGGTGTSNSALTAHAVIMSIAFVVLFPSFAISIHIIPYAKTVPRIHAPLQLFTLALVIAGLGLGIYLGVDTGTMGNYHPIIGLVVVGMLLLFQPLMGLLQHIHFRRTGGKSVFAYMHRWLGRSIIALGIVNGGLGFLLTKNQGDDAPTGAIIAYSVVAGVLGVAYIIFVVVLPFRSKESAEAQKRVSSSESSEGIHLQERASYQ